MLYALPAAGAAWLLRAGLDRVEHSSIWSFEIFIASAAAFIGFWSIFHIRRTWVRPTQQLLEAIEQARDKEAPIEELSRITGGVTPLVPIIRELLGDVKQNRAELARLEQEMRQRLAVRTDALERKIGTLQVQATRDALTGLNNRRALEQELPRIVEQYRTGGHSACLLMIDVDYFKQLNDTLGHAAGDQLLKEIGQIIRSTIREQDQAYRCGGDEFVVVLQQANITAGQAMVERLESLVDALARPLRIAPAPRLSIGACALSELLDPTPQSLLEMADKRLYVIKSARKQAKNASKRAG
ncbi:MAG TPA: GGDEF domain-containing protein [Tepidisphaeraceae bacterium]|nr:GGDEF domain-containing protein [Tepidisphaeraceae bacterium]